MNMKISLIGAIPPPVGGISVYVRQLAEKLAEKDVNVEIIDITGVKKTLERENLKLVVVGSWHTIKFVRALLKSQVEVFHAHVSTYRVDPLLLLTSLFSRLRNKKFIVTNLGGGFVGYMERPIYKKILRIIALNVADGIITPEKNQGTKILEVIPPKRRHKVNLLPVPVDIKKFNPKVDGTTVRKKYNIKDSQNLVIFGPHLEKLYAPDHFLKAASIVAKKRQDTVFMLLGDGTLRADLKKMERRMNFKKNLIFGGVIAFEDIQKYYAACDVYCNPCILGQGMSTFEAMACGKPVIGTHAKVQVKIRDKIDGLLFKLGNINDFARKLMWLIEYPEERKQMGINGRRRIQKYYSLEEHTRKLIKIYSQLVI